MNYPFGTVQSEDTYHTYQPTILNPLPCYDLSNMCFDDPPILGVQHYPKARLVNLKLTSDANALAFGVARNLNILTDQAARNPAFPPQQNWFPCNSGVFEKPYPAASGGMAPLTRQYDPSELATPCNVPSATRSVRALSTNGLTTVSWNQPSSAGLVWKGAPAQIEYYQVKAYSQNNPSVLAGMCIAKEALSCNLPSLSPSTTYNIHVSAKGSGGTAQSTASVLGTDPVGFGPETVYSYSVPPIANSPSAPQNLQVSSAPSGIVTLSWRAPSNTGAGGLIYKAVLQPLNANFPAIVSPSTANLSFTTSSLAKGITYQFTVTATDSMDHTGPPNNRNWLTPLLTSCKVSGTNYCTAPSSGYIWFIPGTNNLNGVVYPMPVEGGWNVTCNRSNFRAAGSDDSSDLCTFQTTPGPLVGFYGDPIQLPTGYNTVATANVLYPGVSFNWRTGDGNTPTTCDTRSIGKYYVQASCSNSLSGSCFVRPYNDGPVGLDFPPSSSVGNTPSNTAQLACYANNAFPANSYTVKIDPKLTTRLWFDTPNASPPSPTPGSVLWSGVNYNDFYKYMLSPRTTDSAVKCAWGNLVDNAPGQTFNPFSAWSFPLTCSSYDLQGTVPAAVTSDGQQLLAPTGVSESNDPVTGVPMVTWTDPNTYAPGVTPTYLVEVDEGCTPSALQTEEVDPVVNQTHLALNISPTIKAAYRFAVSILIQDFETTSSSSPIYQQQ